MPEPIYDESTIKSLDWKEHIRTRPGMYIGKLGDGSSHDDGIYILLKEVVDNCIDEFIMGHGKTIDIKVSGQKVTVRDYGRGIPLGKVIDCVSKINTGGKYDTAAFKKSVGLNGIGTKAVNALSDAFTVQSVRDGEMKLVDYSKGEIVQDYKIEKSSLRNGTKVVFQPDSEIFKNFHYLPEYIEDQIWNYVYLNSGLNIQFNGEKYFSENGLKDLLERKTDMEKIRYPVIHLRGDDIEVALTHGDQYGEEYYSFVNGQHTTQGGTHLAAFREAIVRTMREYYKKDFDASDIRASIIGAISLRIQNPIFESQTKTRLGSIELSDDGPTVRIFINDFIKRELDNFLHQNTDIADYLLKRIMQSERERKDLAGIKKLANQRAKKANLHNKKLRDCKVHLNDEKADDEKRLNSTIFITEGDSASGSITKSRDVATQAVFSLRGKPLNSFGMKKKVVYENEEFNLLQHALNIEEGLDNLRYNQVVVATDADVDGMHIRLLILTFFLQFFPDLVKNGHVYILETPLFRVRNKKKTLYCFSENEKKSAINTLGGNPEITRFKGLGEISPEEFGLFIGESIRLEPVIIRGKTSVNDLLKYYMGKNTEERQKFIIENLRVEDDELENIHG
ncbi:MAG: type IIA DNA topoisomerase subunit B [Candidatus Marinimicrobia bacterium]|jgi:topoisomerase-4 subunit B|nr:type IIA DNA topoisomerase subunit B [Candidatus Neomarinimicrobiota bacterium]HIB14482.1 type IIA DNA topoisomerase subunit B [Candidatus Neomarinimicrobiota bacterium]HIG51046.1 type IIA DNA topoisomerase subunit B [Candidatus Neomarinimicrobiota bacterium]